MKRTDIAEIDLDNRTFQLKNDAKIRKFTITKKTTNGRTYAYLHARINGKTENISLGKWNQTKHGEKIHNPKLTEP